MLPVARRASLVARQVRPAQPERAAHADADCVAARDEPGLAMPAQAVAKGVLMVARSPIRWR